LCARDKTRVITFLVSWRRLWPHLRAGLVLLHIVAVVALAIPSLRAGLDRASWADPTVQDELRAWAARFDMEPADFEEKAWRFAQGWSRLHRMITAPFEPYRAYIGVRQPWVMFVAPQRHPARVEIELLEGGAWRTIYRERSSEHDWNRALFDHDRMRSAFFRFGWDRYASSYREFSEWVAKEAARDFPEATSVRVRMYRHRTPSPEEVKTGRAPAGRWEKQIVQPLSPHR
jgi:hypothetical protein